MPDIGITIVNLEPLLDALRKFPRETQKYLRAAGKESGTAVIDTLGLKSYPPATAANQPPVPYYIRGRGTETRFGNRGNSENLGKQFNVSYEKTYTILGNRASYAPYVIGEEQAWWMTIIGWRQLGSVVEEKLEKINTIYNNWVDKLLRDLKL